MWSRSRVSRRRKEYLGKQWEAALSRLQFHLIWMPMMPPCRVGTDKRAFLGAPPGGDAWDGDRARKAGVRAYLHGHVLEAVPCALHDFAKTEDGAEGVCPSVVNA